MSDYNSHPTMNHYPYEKQCIWCYEARIRALEAEAKDIRAAWGVDVARAEKAEAALAAAEAEFKTFRILVAERAAGREAGAEDPTHEHRAGLDLTCSGCIALSAAKPAALGAPFVPPLPPSADDDGERGVCHFCGAEGPDPCRPDCECGACEAPPMGSSPIPRPFDQRTGKEKIEDAIDHRRGRHAETQECGT